jgi:hypothetical protein
MTTDYRSVLHGHYDGTHFWSTRMHITSPQSEAALLATVSAAWAAAWAHGTYGFRIVYPTTTGIDSVTMYTLDAALKGVSKSVQAIPDVGLSAVDTEPWEVAIDVELRNGGLRPDQRGRIKLPAPDVTVFTANVMDTTIQGHLKSAVSDVFAAIRADGSTVFTYPRKATKRGVAALTHNIMLTEVISSKPGVNSVRTREIKPVYL